VMQKAEDEPWPEPARVEGKRWVQTMKIDAGNFVASQELGDCLTSTQGVEDLNQPDGRSCDRQLGCRAIYSFPWPVAPHAEKRREAKHQRRGRHPELAHQS